MRRQIDKHNKHRPSSGTKDKNQTTEESNISKANLSKPISSSKERVFNSDISQGSIKTYSQIIEQPSNKPSPNDDWDIRQITNELLREKGIDIRNHDDMSDNKQMHKTN